MIFDGQLITNLSGRLGTKVYARSRRQQYVREMGNPNPNPPTEEQDICREALAQVWTAWVALTDEQRQAWHAYSLRTLRPGRTGHLRSIGAWPEFTRANIVRKHATAAGLVTLASVTVPPPADAAAFPLPFPTAANVAGDDDLTVTFDDTAAWFANAEDAIIVYVSTYKPATVNFWKSPMTIVAALNSANGGSPASFRLHADPISETGNHLFVRYRFTSSTGLLSVPHQETVTVTA